MTPSPLWTRGEAAAYLRVSLATFERLRIDGIRIRGRVFYTQSILDDWLALRVPATMPAPLRAQPRTRPLSLQRTPDAQRMHEALERRRARRHAEVTRG
jgi:hypothetical protein